MDAVSSSLHDSNVNCLKRAACCLCVFSFSFSDSSPNSLVTQILGEAGTLKLSNGDHSSVPVEDV